MLLGTTSRLSGNQLEVPSSLLLKCAAELAPALKVLFSQSLTHGFIPSSLKRAATTLVYKSGTKTSPSNYRPISLTSTIIKVFERIIRKQIVAFMNKQGHQNNTQHGFRSGRSCLSALLDVFDDLMHMLSSDTTVDMIYLAPNDTAHKQWSCHSELKLLCKLCRTSPPPAMGA